MTRWTWPLAAVICLGVGALAAPARDDPPAKPETGLPRAAAEALRDWQWYVEIPEPKAGKGDYDLPSTDVLNVAAARDENAERHLCPMPLNITRRQREQSQDAAGVPLLCSAVMVRESSAP